MKHLIKLMRPKHYIKNILIALPLFFNGSFFIGSNLLSLLLGFLSFSLVCSAVYILNDLQDIEKDRQHPTKCTRPIASGAVSVPAAKRLLAVCGIASLGLSFFGGILQGYPLMLLYFLLNVVYSMGWKNKPIVDVVILTSGFVLRILYGAVITNVPVSGWLYLTVFAGAFFLSLGKRRNELRKLGTSASTRDVLQHYNYAFLDRNMYVCLTLVNAFYALWAMDQNNPIMIWTVPLVIVILMKYSLDIEGDSDGDPVEVVLHDRLLILLCGLYAATMFFALYL